MKKYLFIFSCFFCSIVQAQTSGSLLDRYPNLYPFIQLILPIFTPIIPTIAFIWAVYIFQAGQERLRREKAVEIIRTYISVFTVEVRAVLKIAENLSKQQNLSINSGNAFEIDIAMLSYLNISLPGINFNFIEKEGKIIVDALSSFKLRTIILNFLNSTEIVCSAWVYDVCNSEIIVSEVNFIYDDAEELSILEKFRAVTHSNVHYPNIVKFVNFLRDSKSDRKNPVKRFSITIFKK